MSDSIGVVETTDSPAAEAHGGLALRLDPARQLTLRFQFVLGGDADVEALRYARRVMIREERTRGLDRGEPSIEGAIFTLTAVSWEVSASQAAWCREKVRELIARANRLRRGQ